MSTTNLQKIKKLILNVDIPLDEAEELINSLSKISNSELEDVLNLFSGDPSWIKKINNIYKAKKVTFITKNPKIWQQILREEEKLLKEVK